MQRYQSCKSLDAGILGDITVTVLYTPVQPDISVGEYGGVEIDSVVYRGAEILPDMSDNDISNLEERLWDDIH